MLCCEDYSLPSYTSSYFQSWVSVNILIFLHIFRTAENLSLVPLARHPVGVDLSPYHEGEVGRDVENVVEDNQGQRAVILLQLYVPITLSRFSTPSLLWL